MSDLTLSTRRGFIAPLLIKALNARSFGTPLHAPAARASILINLSNAHDNPGANVQRALALADSLEGNGLFIQFQSFATLHGRGDFDLAKFNCGMNPYLADKYVIGKLAVERALLQTVQTRDIRVVFIYVPAVIDEQSPWWRIVRAVGDGDLELPATISARAAFNHVSVQQLAEIIANLVRRASEPGWRVGRVIANSPRPAEASFEAYVRAQAAAAGRPLNIRREALASALRRDAAAFSVTLKRVVRSLLPGRGRPTAAALVAAAGAPSIRGVSRYTLARQGWISAAVHFGDCA